MTYTKLILPPFISELGQLVPEKPGQNSRQAKCGIFRLATVCCPLCESYTQLHHREKSYNSISNWSVL